MATKVIIMSVYVTQILSFDDSDAGLLDRALAGDEHAEPIRLF